MSAQPSLLSPETSGTSCAPIWKSIRSIEETRSYKRGSQFASTALLDHPRFLAKRNELAWPRPADGKFSQLFGLQSHVLKEEKWQSHVRPLPLDVVLGKWRGGMASGAIHTGGRFPSAVTSYTIPSGGYFQCPRAAIWWVGQQRWRAVMPTKGHDDSWFREACQRFGTSLSGGPPL
jgi:hypothetical protein